MGSELSARVSLNGRFSNRALMSSSHVCGVLCVTFLRGSRFSTQSVTGPKPGAARIGRTVWRAMLLGVL